MEPSSSCVEYHDFLDVFLQQSSFNQKAECHVQESSGKDVKRRFGSGETETYEFGVKEPPEYEANSSARVECFEQPGESRIGSEWCFFSSQQEAVARQLTKTQQRILKRGNKMTLNLPATGNWSGVVNLQAQPAPGNWSEVMTF